MISRRPARLMTRYLSRSRGPVSLLLQGFFFILLGLIVMLFNLNHTGQIQKVTGSISDVFGGAYISLAGDQNVYTFVLDDFHPAWNGVFFQGQKADIYTKARRQTWSWRCNSTIILINPVSSRQRHLIKTPLPTRHLG